MAKKKIILERVDLGEPEHVEGLVRIAVDMLNIDLPIMRYEISEGELVIHLYGGSVQRVTLEDIRGGNPR